MPLDNLGGMSSTEMRKPRLQGRRPRFPGSDVILLMMTFIYGLRMTMHEFRQAFVKQKRQTDTAVWSKCETKREGNV